MTSGQAPAGERAYDDVKQRIISGDLAGGELISEGEVADRLGVSRTPVREAFLRLQSEGFMRLYPKRGALITPIEHGESRDVLEARALVETRSVERVTADPERTAALVATLEERLATQLAEAKKGGGESYARADVDFHAAIVEASGNIVLRQFYGTLRDRQLRMIAASVPVGGRRTEEVAEQHRGLLEAIRERDAARFAALLQEHFDEVYRNNAR
jgi:DNA-binding GntR family transcriptional regulator